MVPWGIASLYGKEWEWSKENSQWGEAEEKAARRRRSWSSLRRCLNGLWFLHVKWCEVFHAHMLNPVHSREHVAIYPLAFLPKGTHRAILIWGATCFHNPLQTGLERKEFSEFIQPTVSQNTFSLWNHYMLEARQHHPVGSSSRKSRAQTEPSGRKFLSLGAAGSRDNME